jgi:hypothetical protein
VTVELYGSAPPNSVSFVLAWLLPLAGDPENLGSKRWEAGAPLPYRMVRLIDGADDQISAYPIIRVHTFAADYTTASREADATHRRMLVLADDPLTDVAMPDGSTANCEWLTAKLPHEEPYASSAVVSRFVAEYRMGLHFGPVSS